MGSVMRMPGPTNRTDSTDQREQQQQQREREAAAGRDQLQLSSSDACWYLGPSLGVIQFPPGLQIEKIYYLDKYFDKHYECRHVMLPRELSKQVLKTHMLSEEEWRTWCPTSENHTFCPDDLFPKINKNEVYLGSSVKSF
ncbi:Cyclin-dependent kinases regulatory subunit 2 [Galemys pyrenaicus]|uniref:Cyclin-dependent kinases regulatory subunit n=1 Tax=Galemys pyrenaicus TaxID=202257 RepID=A0A8J6AAZ3_GALPY|nr:Cyclin-dependent kinases regulatory subunit 2 [Galemys pyrenaicus]